MKVKHISIKDFLIRARKKGKQRGRPSKREIIISQILSQQLKEITPEMQKSINEMIMCGTGILKVSNPL